MTVLTTPTPHLHRTVTQLFAAMGEAWAEGDAGSFGRLFTADADFIEVRGGHHVGRTAITAGHRALWAGVYADSTVEYRVEAVRPLGEHHGVGVVAATLQVPDGALAGTHHARITAVVADGPGGWQIASFHNTLVGEPLALAPAEAPGAGARC